jgi:hypothetical protein
MMALDRSNQHSHNYVYKIVRPELLPKWSKARAGVGERVDRPLVARKNIRLNATLSALRFKVVRSDKVAQ